MFLTTVALSICLCCTAFLLLFSMVQLDLVRRFLVTPRQQSRPDGAGVFPYVSVQLPMYNERFVAGRLLEAVALLDWPADKLEIQILDDSTDDTSSIVAEHAERMRHGGLMVKVINRKDRSGFKAGALAHGLETASGAFIAIFDADFIPQPEFLRQTIPFFQDQQVGAVQARWGHLNEGQNILTRLQALGLDAHFTIEQAARERSGCFLNFNGTCGVWRADAIREAGGWSPDTLTEDLDLSYRAQLKGWRICYTPELIVKGELPDGMAALKAQQFRWTKGGAETARKLLKQVIGSRLAPAQKLHAVMHLATSLVFPAILLSGLSGVVLVWSAESPLSRLGGGAFVGFLSVSVFYLVSMLYNRSHRLWQLPLFLLVTMGLSWHNSVAVLSGYAGRKTPFLRTPKRGDQHDRSGVSSLYRSAAGAGWLMELLLAILFGATAFTALSSGRSAFVVMHGMLAIGLAMVSAVTVAEVIRSEVK